MVDSLTDRNFIRPLDAIKNSVILSLKKFFSKHEIYTWNNNHKNSKITISDAFPESKDQENKFPLLVVKRGDFRWRNRHLDQAQYNNMQEIIVCRDFLVGDFSINCASSVGGEADVLAEEVFLFMTFFRNVIAKRQEFIFDIKDLSIGPETPYRGKGSEVEVTITPVRLLIEGEVGWELIENGHELEGFNIRQPIKLK